MQLPEDGIPVKGAKTLSSNAIVIFPAVADEKTVQLNLIGPGSTALRKLIGNELQQKGYRIQNANTASYRMTVHLLYRGSSNQDAVDDVLLQGYDAPIWPAGAIAVGKEQYTKTAARSRAAYMIVADLMVKHGQEIYQTRLISYYPNWLSLMKEQNTYDALNQSLANFITAIF